MDQVDPNEKNKEVEEALEARKKSWTNFQAKIDQKPKKEIMKMLFEACEAIAFMSNELQMKGTEISEIPPKKPGEANGNV